MTFRERDKMRRGILARVRGVGGWIEMELMKRVEWGKGASRQGYAFDCLMYHTLALLSQMNRKHLHTKPL